MNAWSNLLSSLKEVGADITKRTTFPPELNNLVKDRNVIFQGLEELTNKKANNQDISAELDVMQTALNNYHLYLERGGVKQPDPQVFSYPTYAQLKNEYPELEKRMTVLR